MNFIFFTLLFNLFIIQSVRGISFRYQHNDEYNSHSFGRVLQPKLLSQSVDLKEIPVQTVRITKTLAFQVPVPYPVPYPYQIPVYVKSPQIFKGQTYSSTHPHLNPVQNNPQGFGGKREENGQYNFSHSHWNTPGGNNFNEHSPTH